MRTLAVANLKGGTGKTSVAVHLAEGARRSGRRVLLVDLDQQGNATAWLLGSVAPSGGSAAVLRSGRLNADELHEVEGREGLHVLPASPELASADVALAGEIGGEALLRAALAAHADRFDLVVIDCPPALGLTVLNALVAADAVVLPVVASHLALSGLAQITAKLEVIRERLSRPVRLLGVVLFAADAREGITAEARDILREGTGVLLAAEVRVSSAAKALSASCSTAFDGGDPRGAEDYAKLTAEVLARLEGEGVGR